MSKPSEGTKLEYIKILDGNFIKAPPHPHGEPTNKFTRMREERPWFELTAVRLMGELVVKVERHGDHIYVPWHAITDFRESRE